MYTNIKHCLNKNGWSRKKLAYHFNGHVTFYVMFAMQYFIRLFLYYIECKACCATNNVLKIMIHLYYPGGYHLAVNLYIYKS